MRERAEKLMEDQQFTEEDGIKDLDELINELKIHHIELELQNEDLRNAQLNLEDSRRKYYDLYNFAPNWIHNPK